MAYNDISLKGTMKVKKVDGTLVPFYPKTKTECIYDTQSGISLSSIISEMETSIQAAASSGGVKTVHCTDNEISDSEMNGYSNETLAVFLLPYTWKFTIDTEASAAGEKTTGIPFNLYSQPDAVLDVDWGDGNASHLTASDYAADDARASLHEYAVPGVYSVSVTSGGWADVRIITISPYQGTGLQNGGNLNNSVVSLYWWKRTLISIDNAIPGIKKQIFYSSIDSSENVDSINLSSLFNSCFKLKTVSPDLFANIADIENLAAFFFNCQSLEAIPPELFKPCANATNFHSCFQYCSSLQSIPANLFKYSTKAVTFICCFSSCSSLQSIPAGLFKSNKAIIEMDQCFQDCSSITAIPSNLFVHNTAIVKFGGCFGDCTALQSIPAGLFDSNTAAVEFDACFQGCTSNTSIPEDLFKYNINAETFNSCFRHNKITSIPTDLFKYNTNATRLEFCFNNCMSINTNISLRIGSSIVTDCSSFLPILGVSYTVYVPENSTTYRLVESFGRQILDFTLIGE